MENRKGYTVIVAYKKSKNVTSELDIALCKQAVDA